MLCKAIVFLLADQVSASGINQMIIQFSQVGFRDAQEPHEIAIRLALKTFSDVRRHRLCRLHHLLSKPPKLSRELEDYVWHFHCQAHGYLPYLKFLKALGHRDFSSLAPDRES